MSTQKNTPEEEENTPRSLADAVNDLKKSKGGSQETDDSAPEEEPITETVVEEPHIWYPPNNPVSEADQVMKPLMRDKFAITRSIKHVFNTEEKEELAQELADLVKKKEELEDAKKSAASQYKAQIDSTDGELRIVSGKVKNGYEYHNHEVHVYYDPDNALKLTGPK